MSFSLNDRQIDELRDSKGNMSGRAPSQEWTKPESVTLRKKTFRNILEGSLKQGSELEFVVRNPGSSSQTRAVRPSRDILEQFLSLAVANDEDIYRFASRYGALLVYCSHQPHKSD